MSDTEYLSMKQIADQLNVSKQRVYRCIKSNCISEAHHEVVKGNTVLMYDNAAVERIKQLLGVTNDETVEVHLKCIKKQVKHITKQYMIQCMKHC